MGIFWEFFVFRTVLWVFSVRIVWSPSYFISLWWTHRYFWFHTFSDSEYLRKNCFVGDTKLRPHYWIRINPPSANSSIISMQIIYFFNQGNEDCLLWIPAIKINHKSLRMNNNDRKNGREWYTKEMVCIFYVCWLLWV